MTFNDIILLENVVGKLAVKHQVKVHEVEEVLIDKPVVRFLEKGDRAGEDLYFPFGRNQAGRYPDVLFIRKSTHKALIVTARDMTKSERKSYDKQ